MGCVIGFQQEKKSISQMQSGTSEVTWDSSAFVPILTSAKLFKSQEVPVWLRKSLNQFKIFVLCEKVSNEMARRLKYGQGSKVITFVY